MNITAAELAGLVGAYIWPLFRIGALVMVAPIFSAQSVPTRVRMAVALVLTSVVVPVLPQVPAVDPFSLPALSIIAQQLLIGIAMGFALQLVFGAIVTGGQIIAMQMGLGFASMVDPQNGQQVPVLSQLYLMMTTLLFLGMDAHLVLVEVLVESFTAMPIAPDGITRSGMWALANWGTDMFAAAVWLALPAMASILVVNIAFGVMARAAPQLNIFVIGFPITMMMGFVVILFVLPSAVPQFTQLVNDIFTLVRQLLNPGGG